MTSASKLFYKANECKYQCPPRGDAVFSLTSTEVDGLGKSYYASLYLYLLFGRRGWKVGGVEGGGGVLLLPLTSGSVPVSESSWMPNITKLPKFVLISSKMSLVSFRYHGITGEPHILLGVPSHRNSISWSPRGLFLNLGIFGNLLGWMYF